MKIIFHFSRCTFRMYSRCVYNIPFISSSLPKGLNGGCSEGLFEEFDGAGLAAFALLPLTLPASLAPLLVSDSGFCAAGKMI